MFLSDLGWNFIKDAPTPSPHKYVLDPHLYVELNYHYLLVITVSYRLRVPI